MKALFNIPTKEELLSILSGLTGIESTSIDLFLTNFAEYIKYDFDEDAIGLRIYKNDNEDAYNVLCTIFLTDNNVLYKMVKYHYFSSIIDKIDVDSDKDYTDEGKSYYIEINPKIKEIKPIVQQPIPTPKQTSYKSKQDLIRELLKK